jgi:hypothetical protein
MKSIQKALGIATVLALSVGFAVGLTIGTFYGVAGGVFVFLFGTSIGWVRHQKNANWNSDNFDQLQPTIRSRLLPMERIRREIKKLGEEHAENPIVSVMLSEILPEIDGLVMHGVRLLEARKKLVGLTESRAKVKQAIMIIEQKLSAANDPSVREAQEKALIARRDELANYHRIDEQVHRLDATLAEMESGLAELKSRLAVAAATPDAKEEMARQELQDITGRLKSLGVSMEESIEFVGTKF